MHPATIDTELGRLGAIDLTIANAAMILVAAGASNDEAIRRTIEVMREVPAVRKRIAKEEAETRITVSLEDMRREFEHGDHRRLRHYVREIWGEDSQSLWLKAISAPQAPAFTVRQANAIRELRRARRHRLPIAAISDTDTTTGEAKRVPEDNFQAPNGNLAANCS